LLLLFVFLKTVFESR